MFNRKAVLIVIGGFLVISFIWGGSIIFWPTQEITTSDQTTESQKHTTEEKNPLEKANNKQNNPSAEGRKEEVSRKGETEGLSDSRKEELADASYSPARETLLDDLESNLSRFDISTPTEKGQFYLVRKETSIVNDQRVEAIVEDGYYRVKIEVLFELHEGELRWTIQQSTVQ